MTHEVIRDDEVFHKAAVEVYDFDQQGRFTHFLEIYCISLNPNTFTLPRFVTSGNFHVPQASYNILPGDGFRTVSEIQMLIIFASHSSYSLLTMFIEIHT